MRVAGESPKVTTVGQGAKHCTVGKRVVAEQRHDGPARCGSEIARDVLDERRLFGGGLHGHEQNEGEHSSAHELPDRKRNLLFGRHFRQR